MNTFDHEAKGFTVSNALACADASQRAYTAPNLVCGPAAAYVLDTEHYVVIAFRGTQSFWDLLTDSNLFLHWIGVSTMAVHSGFWGYYQVIKDAVTKAAGPLSTKRIFITGHSLGGAIATLFAHSLSHQNIQIYTFGQPRVGTGSFAESYAIKNGKKHFRVVHAEDIVARVPTWPIYRHAKTELRFFNWRGTLLKNPIWWRRLRSDWRGIRRAVAVRRDVLFNDHHIGLYIDALTKHEAKLQRQATVNKHLGDVLSELENQ